MTLKKKKKKKPDSKTSVYHVNPTNESWKLNKLLERDERYMRYMAMHAF